MTALAFGSVPAVGRRPYSADVQALLDQFATDVNAQFDGLPVVSGFAAIANALGEVGWDYAAVRSNVDVFSKSESDAQYVQLSSIDIDSALTANSDTRVASQKATKTYVDTSISGLTGAVVSVNTRTGAVVGLAEVSQVVGIVGNHGGYVLGTDTDIYFPASTWSAGVLTGGVVRQATAIKLGSTYTQTSDPADTSVGTSLYINWNPTLNNTGAASQTGFFGPRGVIQVEGTVTYQQTAGFLHLSPVGYAEQLIQKNAPGVAVNMYGSWGMILNRIWEADAATVTLFGTDASAGHTSVIDNAVYFTKNSGTLDGGSHSFEHVGFLSEPAILGNTTVSRIGFDVADFATGSGQVAVIGGQSWGTGADADAHSVPLNIGLRIKPLLHGTTNIGILSQSSVIVSDGTDAHGSTLINAGSVFGIPVAGISIYKDATDAKPVVELLADGGAGLLAFGPGGSSLPDFSIQRTGAAAALVAGTLTLPAPIFTSPVVSDGTFTVVDGTAGHGSVLAAVSAFGPGFNLFANTTDTQAAALLAIVGGAPTLAFGPGGTTARDVKIVRSGSAAALATGVFTFTSPVFAGTPTATGGSLVVTDGTAGHGSVGLGVGGIGGAVQVFANTADTTVAAQLSAAGLQIGPGGSAATDVKLLRTGVSAAAFTGVFTMTSPVINTGVSGSAIDTDATFATGASTTVTASSAVKTALALKATLAAATTFTAGTLALTNTVDTSSFTVTDDNAAHGAVFAGVGVLGPSIGIFANSGDTVQRNVLGVTGMSLGPGGSSATDTKFLRTGVAAATITGQTTFATGITMSAGAHIALATTGAGTQIGTGATQLLGFYGTTAVVQPAGTTDVVASLVTLGLRAASSNPPLNLGTGALTAGVTSLGATTSLLSGVSTKVNNYTMVLGDASSTIIMNKATAITLTIPANASVAYAIGTVIYFVNIGVGAMTLAITTDTLVGTTAYLTNKGGYIIKGAATTWYAFATA